MGKIRSFPVTFSTARRGPRRNLSIPRCGTLFHSMFPGWTKTLGSRRRISGFRRRLVQSPIESEKRKSVRTARRPRVVRGKDPDDARLISRPRAVR